MNPQCIETYDTLNERFAIGAELIKIKNEIRIQSKLKEQYGTLYEYAKIKFGLSKSIAKRTIAITKYFDETEDNGNPTGKIKPEYANFTMGQLTQMLYMPEELRKQVTPHMTIEQIRTLSSNEECKPIRKTVCTKSSDKKTSCAKRPNPVDKTDELELHKIILDQALHKEYVSTKDKLMAAAQFCWIQENIKNLPFIHDNYKNVAVYAEYMYDIRKSTTYNMVAVAKRFSIKNEKGEPTGKIKPEFKEFEWAQLVEMNNLTDDMIGQVTPETSARDIILMRTGKAPVSKETIMVHKELYDIANQLDEEGYQTLLDVAKRLKKIQDTEKAES